MWPLCGVCALPSNNEVRGNNKKAQKEARARAPGCRVGVFCFKSMFKSRLLLLGRLCLARLLEERLRCGLLGLQGLSEVLTALGTAWVRCLRFGYGSGTVWVRFFPYLSTFFSVLGYVLGTFFSVLGPYLGPGLKYNTQQYKVPLRYLSQKVHMTPG